jgi:phage-related protein
MKCGGGINNANLSRAITRLKRGGTYRDCSTVCVIPTPSGMISTKVATAIWSLVAPMNQKFTKFTVENMEVGDAYQQAVAMILDNPELSKWKYLLTIEHDNLPPQDGLLKLLESIKDYDAVGGLYWVKGEFGQPMIYGDPKIKPRNYIPQLPRKGEVQVCNGLGMGFTLFRIQMFKELRAMGKWPLFKTVQNVEKGEIMTQDLAFFKTAGEAGYKFASDNRVAVGHLEIESGRVW